MAIWTCPGYRNMGGVEPFWRRFSYWGPGQSFPSAGPLPVRSALGYGSALEFPWTWGKWAWNPTVLKHLANYFRGECPEPWIFWRFSRFHCHPWREVSSRPSLRKCIQWTRGQLRESSVFDWGEFQGTCTREWRPHEYTSWLGIRRLWLNRNQPAWWFTRPR